MRKISCMIPTARVLLLCAAIAASGGSAFAQDRTLKFLVGFPAGASLDTMTRLVAERMRVTLGQPVVVENRPGAAGQIAMTALKNSAPDGLTLVMTPLVTVVTAPHIQSLPYDPFADFAPVSHTANFQFAFGVNAQAAGEHARRVRRAGEDGPEVRQLRLGGVRQPAAFLLG